MPREVAAPLVRGKSSKMISFQSGFITRAMEDHCAAMMKIFAAPTYLEGTRRG
jgi:FixJ family two-component response regulator